MQPSPGASGAAPKKDPGTPSFAPARSPTGMSGIVVSAHSHQSADQVLFASRHFHLLFPAMIKKPIANDTLLAQLNWRYATKKFNSAAKIPAADWSTLEQALILSPSSFGLQPWKFLVITDPAIKAALGPASWNQTQPADCSHFVVFTVKKNLGSADVDRLLDRQIEVRGGTLEALAQYRTMMLGSLHGASAAGTLDAWQAHQVYIALGQFMTSAALLGIDTCPMEGIDRSKYDEILKLKDTPFSTVVACAAGYRAADDKYAAAPKVRFRPEELIVHL